jgi:hypothetical protein
MKLSQTVFLSFILYISTFQYVTAQNGEYDLHAGINISRLTDSQDFSRVGLNVGGFITFEKENSFVSLRTGINYSQLGIRNMILQSPNFAVENPSITEIETILQLDYLQVPVAVQIEVFEKLKLYAGPQAGFNVKAALKTTVGDNKSSSSDIDFENKIVVSGVAGFQFFIIKDVFFRAQYELGLTPVFKNQRFDIGSDEIFPGSDNTNRAFTFVAGYRF